MATQVQGLGVRGEVVPFNNVQPPLCSWAIAAFVHHMMAWLPVSSPERAIQPSFITALRAESRKREEDK